MSLPAALANAAWLARGLGAVRRFHAALRAPASAQAAWLRMALARDGGTEFGEAHGLGAVRCYADFARRVPLATWQDHAPWIARIRAGVPNVLSDARVTHLAPTSGSTGGRKLIPFTRGLAAAFDAAVSPWMLDLARQRPGLVTGPAYWSVSPLAAVDDDREGVVPVGFADDAEYLGGAAAWLVRQVLAVPAAVRHVPDEATFLRLTLLALLRHRDLRLLSVWHPSFLELLLAEAVASWDVLLDALAHGTNPWAAALPAKECGGWTGRRQAARAQELRHVGPMEWPRWWPHLAVVSCWGEQAAEPGWRRLCARVPQVLVQRKGLLATEAVVTVPIGDALPLAVTSHFFEFIDAAGEVRRAHELTRGATYEVVVTNGGGLWRYRLGDLVECTGHVAATPSLRFLGRAGTVSDLRGEKLDEAFVASALGMLWRDAIPPAVAQLRAWDDGQAAGYELLLDASPTGEPLVVLGTRLDEVLSANPHYALARRLGQLAPLRVVTVPATSVHEAMRGHPGRLGDAKPQVLLRAGASPASA